MQAQARLSVNYNNTYANARNGNISIFLCLRLCLHFARVNMGLRKRKPKIFVPCLHGILGAHAYLILLGCEYHLRLYLHFRLHCSCEPGFLEQNLFDCQKLTLRTCCDRDSAVSNHSDWMTSDFTLYDWLSGLPHWLA
jgi:hypothetical protein